MEIDNPQLTPASFGSTTGTVCQGNDPRLVGGGGSARRMSTDAHDICVWTCDEPSGATIVNSGVAVGCNLTVAGAAFLGRLGVHGGALYSPGASTDSAYGARVASAEPAYPVSMSCWIKLHSINGNWTYYFGKAYHSASWSAPYASLELFIGPPGSQVINFRTGIVSTGAHDLASTEPFTLDVWHLIGGEYDGANQFLYQDGNLVGQQACTGDIDYNTGDRGDWIIGGLHGLADASSPGYIDDARVANVIRGLAWHQEAYRRGIGMYP